jgi:hypothetical protein
MSNDNNEIRHLTSVKGGIMMFHGRYFLILFLLLSAGCATPPPATVTPTEPVVQLPATAAITPPARSTAVATETASPAPPTVTPPPAVRPPVTVTPRPTAVPPTATPFPSTDELPAALVWQPVPGVMDYPLQRLAGWANGFRTANYCRYGPYRWLDGEHLLLMPVIGYGEGAEETRSQITQPLVLSGRDSPQTRARRRSWGR